MGRSPEKAPLGAADETLASFVVLARFLGVLADPDQIHHDRGQGDKPYDFDDLLRIAGKIGITARRRSADMATLAKLPLPALIARGDGGTAILLKAERGEGMEARYLVLMPGEPRPEIYSEHRVQAMFIADTGAVELL